MTEKHKYKIVAVRLENEIAMVPMCRIAETDDKMWAEAIVIGLKKTDLANIYGFNYIENK